MRAFYINNSKDFCNENGNQILGTMAQNNGFDLNDKQKNTWIFEIKFLKQILNNFTNSKIIFEYTIPRIGKRIDNVLLYKNIVFLLEFKVGESEYNKYEIDQVLDYALDLKNFHQESYDKLIVPILVCTEAKEKENIISSFQDKIIKPLICNKNNLKEMIEQITELYNNEQEFNYDIWINSPYMPTPTIIEAAQALYANHNVTDISRSDSGAYNLTITTEKINEIIEYSKSNHKKSICFITGVPGAGKTLAGINIANSRHNFDENEHAVFLSGNFPLVDVLQEALARDDVKRKKSSKKDALRNATSFIQIIHHYRDAYVDNYDIPTEKVVIFDEAQRAWTKEQITSFMSRKKGVLNFQYSEPEFLISTMDRRKDWAVIICLVGGGQEINTGEAGLIEWFESLKRSFPHWDVYVSNMISDDEYTRGENLNQLTKGLNLKIENDLHLATSIRSFRSEYVSQFVKNILDNELVEAQKSLMQLRGKYPIVLTRNLETAKVWIKSQARGSERYGLLASSSALRLKPVGIFIKNEISAPSYFLNGKDDIRSSYYLEDCASEFDVQGLELDWSIVGWDGNFRYNGTEWTYNNFNGSKWNHVKNESNKLYLKNAYRVLLTRARQGMVIFIPEGSLDDKTRKPEFYDKTYNFLKEIGIEEV